MIKVLIFGCGGSMGRVLADLAQGSDDIEVAAGVDAILKGQEYTFPVFASLAECDVAVDVIVDFSSPKALRGLLDGARQINVPLVIATTGHSDDDREYMMQVAESLPIFQAANMSIGINLLTDLLQKTAAVLGNQFDIEIIEKHHNLKNESLQSIDQHDTKDIGKEAAQDETIDVEYQIQFAEADEVLSLKHTTNSIKASAAGVIRAIRFISGKAPGCYSMKEIIAEDSTWSNMHTSSERDIVSISDGLHGPLKGGKIFKISVK